VGGSAFFRRKGKGFPFLGGTSLFAEREGVLYSDMRPTMLQADVYASEQYIFEMLNSAVRTWLAISSDLRPSLICSPHFCSFRVRKSYPSAQNNFQLRVRKQSPAERNFQLRKERNVQSLCNLDFATFEKEREESDRGEEKEKIERERGKRRGREESDKWEERELDREEEREIERERERKRKR
jgi:hypothetical protein